MTKDLTVGNETKVILGFAAPMIAGNLFQQLYNVVDTLIVGRFIGPSALAAVGSSFTLMVLLTSVIMGLCMGSGVVFSYFFGAGAVKELSNSFYISALFIMAVTILLNGLALFFLDRILALLNIPLTILAMTKDYLHIIICGILFTSIYNYFAAVLRSMGNSMVPLLFLVLAAAVNTVLDIIFVVPFGMGVAGAAFATVIAQAVSAVLITAYCFLKIPEIKLTRNDMKWNAVTARLIVNNSVLVSIQQSVMNLGILMVQGLVNSFGIRVMAAFAAAVKIDSFAYMPAQDFSNAFSTYIAQNRGAGKQDRIKSGIRKAVIMITVFCILISLVVVVFSKQLMMIFIHAADTDVIAIGAGYLCIVGIFYCLIGYLFMLYALFRGLGVPAVSIFLTIISLGTRVILAYVLVKVPVIGLAGIWWAIPAGWFLADLAGLCCCLQYRNKWV